VDHLTVIAAAFARRSVKDAETSFFRCACVRSPVVRQSGMG
jgi:hypothetical protein